MTTEMKHTTTIREKLLAIATYITRLAFWAFVVSIIYGSGLFMWNYINDPTMPMYVKVGVSSLAIFLLALTSMFLLDEE